MRLVGVEGGRGCVRREERWRARDHDGIIRRRPRTLRSRAARGARGKMVAVNPIHFVMALGADGNGGLAGVGRVGVVGGGCEGRGCKHNVPAGRVGRWRRRARRQDEQVGGAACGPKQEGVRSRGCGAARWASRWVWQEPVNKRLSTRARPTGPSVERYLVLVWIIIGLQTAKVAVQGAVYRVQGAGCVRGACGAGRAATVRDPATGVPSLFRRSASFVKKGFLSQQGRARLWRWVTVRGRSEGGAVGEASVKARYLHGVSARHRSWYESGSSSASKGGRWGAGGGRRWAGADFSERATARAARACAGEGAVPRPHARLQRSSGRGWVDRRA